MKKKLLVFIVECLSLTIAAQIRLSPNVELEKALVESGVVHSPLPLDDVRSFETSGMRKKIEASQKINFEDDIATWHMSGLGRLSLSKEKTQTGEQSLKMEFPNFTGKRAIGPSGDPDYATYGYSQIQHDVGGEDWQKFNRIKFYIYPDCDGARVVNLDFIFANAEWPVTVNQKQTSASHLVNLVNHQWNVCYLDLDELQRDKVMKIGFGCSIKGKDITTGSQSVFYIGGMELQQVSNPDIVSGWMPPPGKIIYATSGYALKAEKTAIVNLATAQKESHFQLLEDATGSVVFDAEVVRSETTLGTFGILNFSSFDKEGNYRLKWGADSSRVFSIGSDIWEASQWKVLNFIFCQRCGYAVPEKHGSCHRDLFAEHNGFKISYSGGWHDAGDLSQQTLQTGDVVFSLLEAYEKHKDKNKALSQRLLEEARWGLDFVLRSRFGDGYRASSMGLLIWQDGVWGTLDDISSVRVQNSAFDNFLYAAYEAYAARIMDGDTMFKDYLKKIAKEDFAFALEQFEKTGYGGFQFPYEHTYNTSESQYMATVSWSASMLYQLTHDTYYSALAVRFINFVLDCQQVKPLNVAGELCGFFYRDKTRQSIVHYIHQSREQVYMQALVSLCKTQPDHCDYSHWSNSIQLYGAYLKNLMRYTAPYGMLPSGIYNANEYKDTDSFSHLHLFLPDNAQELYREQLRKGVPLGGQYYLKRFPVWFGIFNGNMAVHLSMGKAAAICGHFMKDNQLLQIGRDQMEWVVGKNPFGQSLIYGEGYDYPQMDSFSSGEMTGEMPVGIRTLGNEDVPYWPRVNNACYKEVWVTSAGKWLSLQAEY